MSHPQPEAWADLNDLEEKVLSKEWDEIEVGETELLERLAKVLDEHENVCPKVIRICDGYMSNPVLSVQFAVKYSNRSMIIFGRG
jgi:hypothetical protein